MNVDWYTGNKVRTWIDIAGRPVGIHSGQDIDRRGTKERIDPVELPIAKNVAERRTSVLERRQDIYGIADEAVPSIQVSVTPIETETEGVGCGIRERRERNIGNSMRPRVRGLERKPFIEAPIQPELHSMVRRITS